MARINATQRRKVADAIAAAEKKTSGEFVAVLAHESDHYLFFTALWAAIGTLLVPGIVLAVGADLNLTAVYAIQLAAFIVVGGALLWSPLKIRFVPRTLRRAHAMRAAQEQFYLLGIHRTREHSGVMLYVSAAERFVQIIADEGVHAHVGEQRWNEIVKLFVERVRRDNIGEGFTSAVHAIADAMAEHYPIRDDDTNELPNELVEL